jgi:anti-sigma regulatory factor (Ser/Thr protein kinase)
MERNWLTARLVEEFQQRLENGLEIGSAVAALRGATLPGIVEYRCLRRASNGQVPALPEAVMASVLGQAFRTLRPASNRQEGSASHKSVRRIDTLPAEFYLIETETDLQTEEWRLFTIRFSRSAQGVGLTKTVAEGLRAALREMAENAVIHSQTTHRILASYRTLDGFAQFCVADVGIGVLNSLRGCPDFQYLRFDYEAIKEALRDGVSCSGRKGGGMGFREIWKALAEEWGILRFRSGEGCIMMDGSGLDADHSREEFVPRLPGFQVTVSCRTDDSPAPEPLV